MICAQEEIRTPTPYGATPSRWCVYQFRHLGLNIYDLTFEIYDSGR